MMSSQSINSRLTIRIVMFSSFVTIFITAFQLYSDYVVAKESIQVSQKYIFTSYKDALETSLWVLNSDLIESQINGIISIPDISYVRIESSSGENWELGVKQEEHILQQSLSLKHAYIDQKYITIGKLIVQSDLWLIYNNLIDKALLILLSNGLKTFIVAGFIIYLVNSLVTQPLNEMRKYLKEFQFQQNNPPMIIKRTAANDDEIDFMIATVNRMCLELSSSYAIVVESQKQLARALDDKQVLLEQETRFKEDLEVMVKERTQKLEDTLLELKATQASMIESEKMASLGALVTGVAHEINTPLGICITSSSFVSSEVEQILRNYEAGELQESTFTESMSNISKSVELLVSNLQKSALLVSSFKQVAVDQSDRSISKFFIKEHLDKLMLSLSHELSKHYAEVEVKCDDKLAIESYPSAYIQIFTNMVSNSLNHGFENWDKERRILINIYKHDADLIIDYRDTGKGIPEDVKGRVFEPFVTTKRGIGGTGLGANIIYNTVSQLLHGKIECCDENTVGARFIITVPLDVVPLAEANG